MIREKRETEIQATLFDEPVDEKTIADVKHEYITVQTADQRADLIEKLKQANAFLLRHRNHRARSANSIAVGNCLLLGNRIEPIMSSAPDDPEEAKAVLEEFRDILEDESIDKIGHNLKYDISRC